MLNLYDNGPLRSINQTHFINHFSIKKICVTSNITLPVRWDWCWWHHNARHFLCQKKKVKPKRVPNHQPPTQSGSSTISRGFLESLDQTRGSPTTTSAPPPLSPETGVTTDHRPSNCKADSTAYGPAAHGTGRAPPDPRRPDPPPPRHAAGRIGCRNGTGGPARRAAGGDQHQHGSTPAASSRL